MTDFMSQIKDADKQKKLNQRIASLAMGEAFKWSFVTGIISTGATVLATMKSKNFSKFMSVSAKVSLPTMATVGMFGYDDESWQMGPCGVCGARSSKGLQQHANSSSRCQLYV
mmetsp:Transcript_5375/g.8770  ORF Transcript_5375/g.8770 Transcript_5375/m.8770 type:complete len:113 (+) Transcript_5375:61-399(+)